MDGWDFRFSNQRTKSTPRSEKLEITFWLDVTYKKKKKQKLVGLCYGRTSIVSNTHWKKNLPIITDECGLVLYV
jgi:hypothetical protein